MEDETYTTLNNHELKKKEHPARTRQALHHRCPGRYHEDDDAIAENLQSITGIIISQPAYLVPAQLTSV